MIDFLLKEKTPVERINFLLSLILGEGVKILTISNDELCNEKEIDLSNIDCLCCYKIVNGDASLLIQLYRYRMDDKLIEKRIINICKKNKIPCYIPINSFDDWVYVNKEGDEKIVKQVNMEKEGRYLFEFI